MQLETEVKALQVIKFNYIFTAKHLSVFFIYKHSCFDDSKWNLYMCIYIYVTQAEVAIMSPRIKYADCQNSLLRAENGSMKQKLSAFSGELTFKEGPSSSLNLSLIIISYERLFFKIFSRSIVLHKLI